MADENGTSIKLAKYIGLIRVDLAENPDFGYESLIKATKQVLDKIELENRSDTSITSAERIDKRPWSSIALREAILNAFLHNDYTTEVPPKFEIFDDRIEITSTGGLPNGLSKDEFFEGFSVPRNKELMRIFKDLGLVEQLGSGVPRILENYGRECFKFTENFLRMTFPKALLEEGDQISGQIGGQMGDIELGEQVINLTTRQKEVLSYILTDQKITRKELAQILDINESAVQKHLKALTTKKIIQRIGTKDGYWEIL